MVVIVLANAGHISDHRNLSNRWSTLSSASVKLFQAFAYNFIDKIAI